MRVSVDLPDPLLRQAKAMAAERGEPLRQMLIRGLRREVSGESAETHRITGPLVPRKKPGHLRITNADIEEILSGR